MTKYEKEASSLKAKKLREDLETRSKLLAKGGKEDRNRSILPKLSNAKKDKLEKEWQESEKELMRIEVQEELDKIKSYNEMVQQKLLNDTMDKLGVDYASHIAMQIKVVALLEATVKANGSPDYNYAAPIAKLKKYQLEKIWENKGEILSQSPAFVKNRQKALALDAIAMMEKLMASFGEADLEKMKTVDKIKLFDSLSKKTEALNEEGKEEESQRFVLDVVISGEVKHTLDKTIMDKKFSFISAEDIEFIEEK